MTFHLLPGQTPWSRCRLPVSVGSASLICVDFRLPNSQLPTIWRRESESNRRIIALQAMALPLGYPALWISWTDLPILGFADLGL